MIYTSNGARETAVEEIGKLYAKLANTRPTETLTHDDIRSLFHYLRALEGELKREIKDNK